jgi:hypothetical protein
MTKQTTSDSENVVQIAGNATVNNYGLALNEVRELTTLFMKENLPVLRAEALAAADENINAFLKGFEEKLAQKFTQIDPNKFRDPDIQSSLNDAVLAAAKKGDKANSDILADLLLERLNSNQDDFVSLVASEAIKIAPTLTRKQVLFLSHVLFQHNFKLTSATSLDQLEPLAAPILALVRPSFGISEPNKSHLQYSGCISIDRIVGNSMVNILKNNYEFLKDTPDQTMVENLEQIYPSLNEFRMAYDKDNIAHIQLTSVGIIIGLTNISRIIGPLHYPNWIN